MPRRNGQLYRRPSDLEHFRDLKRDPLAARWFGAILGDTPVICASGDASDLTPVRASTPAGNFDWRPLGLPGPGTAAFVEQCQSSHLASHWRGL
jgi:hypothetical protein